MPPITRTHGRRRSVHHSIVTALIVGGGWALPGDADAQTRKFVYEGTTVCITHDPGFPIHGTYLYEGTGSPEIVLNADGTGTWENHGTHPVRVRWGVEADESGAPKKQEGPAGVAFRLWFQALEPFRGLNGRWSSGEPGTWDVVELAIGFDAGKVFILRERWQPYSGSRTPTRTQFPTCASAPSVPTTE